MLFNNYFFLFPALESLPVDASNTTTSQCQTPPQLSVDTPRKRKLRFLLKRKHTKISHLSNELAKTRANSPLNSIKTKHEKGKMALKLLKGVISEDLHRLLKSQVILSSKQPKGWRYNSALKSWALSIYHTRGKAYTFLQKVFNLPSKELFPVWFPGLLLKLAFPKSPCMLSRKRLNLFQQVLMCVLF